LRSRRYAIPQANWLPLGTFRLLSALELLWQLKQRLSCIAFAARILRLYASHRLRLTAELIIIQVFQIQCRGVKILEESPLPIEQVVITRPPPAPPQVRTPSKLFSLLSTPPRQGLVTHNPSQRTGSLIGSNSASTSTVVAIPHETPAVLSTPPRQGLVAHNSSQRTGSPIGSNSASTSTAAAIPHETPTNNPSAKRNTRKGGG